jgi:hypothetical protein
LAFLTATGISDSVKIRTCISEAVPHPIYCYDGATNLLSCSYARECIWGETTVVEQSRLDQKKVSNHVFVYENA